MSIRLKADTTGFQLWCPWPWLDNSVSVVSGFSRIDYVFLPRAAIGIAATSFPSRSHAWSARFETTHE